MYDFCDCVVVVCVMMSLLGLTLDKVEMSLSGVFDDGQAYVGMMITLFCGILKHTNTNTHTHPLFHAALSRARNLQGLRLLDFNPSRVSASQTVKEWSEQMGIGQT